MSSTALQICATAFRQANLDQDLTSFSTTQEFPYNIALDLLNEVVSEANRMGDLWFLETHTVLPYTPGYYQFNLSHYGIDPKRILRVRRTLAGQATELIPMNWRRFQAQFREVALIETIPTHWSQFGEMLELNMIPDMDYGVTVSHFKDMPAVTTTGDTLLVPERDDDFLRAGVYAYLLQRLGRSDFSTAYSLYQEKLKSLSLAVKRSDALPRVMPANF